MSHIPLHSPSDIEVWYISFAMSMQHEEADQKCCDRGLIHHHRKDPISGNQPYFFCCEHHIHHISFDMKYNQKHTPWKSECDIAIEQKRSRFTITITFWIWSVPTAALPCQEYQHLKLKHTHDHHWSRGHLTIICDRVSSIGTRTNDFTIICADARLCANTKRMIRMFRHIRRWMHYQKQGRVRYLFLCPFCSSSWAVSS